jgi:hypothetical protein
LNSFVLGLSKTRKSLAEYKLGTSKQMLEKAASQQPASQQSRTDLRVHKHNSYEDIVQIHQYLMALSFRSNPKFYLNPGLL